MRTPSRRSRARCAPHRVSGSRSGSASAGGGRGSGGRHALLCCDGTRRHMGARLAHGARGHPSGTGGPGRGPAAGDRGADGQVIQVRLAAQARHPQGEISRIGLAGCSDPGRRACPGTHRAVDEACITVIRPVFRGATEPIPARKPCYRYTDRSGEHTVVHITTDSPASAQSRVCGAKTAEYVPHRPTAQQSMLARAASWRAPWSFLTRPRSASD